MIDKILYTEKYRPSTIEDIVLPQRIKDKFKDGLVQNLLLEGSTGTGKTSLAKAICKEFKYPTRYINASLETSVDVIRTKIENFCTTRSVMSTDYSIKVVILDEVDGVSLQFFKALRGTIEHFSKHVRFIATCNYVNKVPPEIKSRFETITFDFTKDDELEIKKGYTKRLFHICQTEGLSIDKDAIWTLVERTYPDMRTMVNKIQSFKVDGIKHITKEHVIKFNSIYKDLYNLIFTNIDPVKNYQFIVGEYSNKVDDVFASLGLDFIEYIKDEKTKYIAIIPQVTILISKYQAMRNTVIDPMISLLACIYELENAVHGVK